MRPRTFWIATTLFLSLPLLAKVAIVKPAGQRRPAQATQQDQMANSTFLNFLNCGKAERSVKTEATVFKCVAQFFATTIGKTRIKMYSESVDYPSEYSNLFKCDPEFGKVILAYEDKDYDFFLCFDSNLMDPKRPGVVLFKVEHGVPKILRLKL